MHAWLCTQPTGVDNLAWTELPTPVPKRGEVLIEIRAASLNFPDLLIVQNKYQMKPDPPFVPGSEYAGVVQAVGEGVEHLRVGQNVACLTGTGGFATHAIAPAALCMPLPDGFPHVDAAAFIMIYATSHHALVDRAQLRAGETVLVLGAAGGVGTAAIQIAKKMGARVIAAASSDEKCALCLSTGADAVINYSAENLREAIKGLTDGKGPDVIYDPVGGDFTEPAFRSIAWRGRYLVVGFAAGPIPLAAPEPGAAQGRIDRGRVLGRVLPARAQGECGHDGGAGPLVRRRLGQAGDRPHHAHGPAACGLRTDGVAGRAGQAGAGELTSRRRARPRTPRAALRNCRAGPAGPLRPRCSRCPPSVTLEIPSSAVHARWPTAPFRDRARNPQTAGGPPPRAHAGQLPGAVRGDRRHAHGPDLPRCATAPHPAGAPRPDARPEAAARPVRDGHRTGGLVDAAGRAGGLCEPRSACRWRHPRGDGPGTADGRTDGHRHGAARRHGGATGPSGRQHAAGAGRGRRARP